MNVPITNRAVAAVTAAAASRVTSVDQTDTPPPFTSGGDPVTPATFAAVTLRVARRTGKATS